MGGEQDGEELDAKVNLKLTQYSGRLTFQEADLYYKM